MSLGIGIITNHTFSRAPYSILKSTKNEVKSVWVFLPKVFINKIHSIVLSYGRTLLSEIANKKEDSYRAPHFYSKTMWRLQESFKIRKSLNSSYGSCGFQNLRPARACWHYCTAVFTDQWRNFVATPPTAPRAPHIDAVHPAAAPRASAPKP